ncbi:hypothetical protein BDN70DRAFT_858657 [Pholiota conissans]|uniref:N-acetyltransferase domain-containing protein n=1 Tax=Pholiota conissans TaxID=109636 RepID=A0A9P6D152_9AGAR|nr:hypothetical protein BDN70DRAFT_858657 [Pholiota conissans]
MAHNVESIEKPTELQIEAAVALMLRAMDGDISVDSMTGGNDNLRALLFRSMIRAAAIEGSFYIANDGSDEIFTIGIWFGPGKQMFSTETQRNEGWMDFFNALTPEMQGWWGTVFHAKHEETLNSLLGPKYVDGWFANIIATDPVHQRQGYGSALVNSVCQRAAKEGKICALATQNEKNTEWYKSLGFKVVGQVEIPAPTGNWPDYFLTWERGSSE